MPTIKTISSTGYSGTFEQVSGTKKVSGTFSCDGNKAIKAFSGKIEDTSNDNAVVFSFSDYFNDSTQTTASINLMKTVLDSLITELNA